MLMPLKSGYRYDDRRIVEAQFTSLVCFVLAIVVGYFAGRTLGV